MTGVLTKGRSREEADKGEGHGMEQDGQGRYRPRNAKGGPPPPAAGDGPGPDPPAQPQWEPTCQTLDCGLQASTTEAINSRFKPPRLWCCVAAALQKGIWGVTIFPGVCVGGRGGEWSPDCCPALVFSSAVPWGLRPGQAMASSLWGEDLPAPSVDRR